MTAARSLANSSRVYCGTNNLHCACVRGRGLTNDVIVPRHGWCFHIPPKDGKPAVRAALHHNEAQRRLHARHGSQEQAG